MTTKPKTRKAPAAKASTPKGAPKAAPTETKQQASEIRRLISRWKWLEADQDYQADMAATEEESSKLICKHVREQEEIARQLVDKNTRDFFRLLRTD
jgi:hypothetical protein